MDLLKNYISKWTPGGDVACEETTSNKTSCTVKRRLIIQKCRVSVWAKVMNKGKGLITKHKAFFDIRGD